jgi:hypothetical protein
MADIVLIRRTNGTYARYTDCTAVSLTGQVTAYGSITGVEATDIITIPGLTAVNGMALTITNLAGGAGLTANIKYYLINASGSTAQLATSQGGSAVDFTTNITSATNILIQTDELMVWSAEYRDIFNPKGVALATSNVYGIGTLPTMTAALASNLVMNPADAGPSGGGYTSGDPSTTNSDEIGHNPLRQTFLARTHWKFTMATGPTPLYATWADGDIIANSPPNT